MKDEELSAEFQRDVARMVYREVHYCVSCLMSEILPRMMEDGDYQEEAKELIFGRTYYVPWLDDAGEGAVYDTEEAAQKWVDSLPEDEQGWTIEEHIDEIFEHWIVSSWFKDKLREKGEIVEDIHGVDVWGRTCTGQSISLDGVICEIYKATRS